MAVQALAHVGVRGSYNAEGELMKFLVEKVTNFGENQSEFGDSN